MAIANSYPVGTVKTEDLILGTSIPLAGTNDKPVTKNFSVASVLALGSPPNVLTATVLVTDAQLRTLGTAPVEILPAVAGYSYQMLGLSTVTRNAGGAGDDYDWGTQSAVFSWRTSAPLSSEHRVEIPYTVLPDGGLGPISGGIQVGTLIAGNFRVNASLKLSVTSSTNPIITGTPSATWKINVTYRLIETS